MEPNMHILESDEFTVFQADAVDLAKGASDDKRVIAGFASTEHKDRQDEVVLARGLDFSEFVKAGWFNDNHSQATAAIVGFPVMAQHKPTRGWYTEGEIFKGYKRADELWELAKTLNGTPRKLGFSIEGKVIERRGNYIVKAKIRNVAITNCPVNTNCTWDIVAKSFDPEFSEEMVFEDERDLTAVKALAVGHDRVASVGGRVMVPEDLEKDDEVTHLFSCPKKGCERTFKSGTGLDRHLERDHSVGKSATFVRSPRVMQSEAEVAEFIKSIRPHYSDSLAARVAKFVVSNG